MEPHSQGPHPLASREASWLAGKARGAQRDWSSAGDFGDRRALSASRHLSALDSRYAYMSLLGVRCSQESSEEGSGERVLILTAGYLSSGRWGGKVLFAPVLILSPAWAGI